MIFCTTVWDTWVIIFLLNYVHILVFPHWPDRFNVNTVSLVNLLTRLFPTYLPTVQLRF